MEYVPGTAIEQYFNQLIQMGLVSQVVLSDRQGNTILSCFGLTPSAPAKSAEDFSKDCIRHTASVAAPNPTPTEGAASAAAEEDMPIESNVVLSGARCFQNLEQLQLRVPKYISAQYHDASVVQVLDRGCFLTLLGYRSQGHCVGGLLALVPQIQECPVYLEIVAKVEKCFQ